MSKYYCLIAGLPEISLDDHKIPFTIAEFRDELNEILQKKDKALIGLFYLKYDNKNILGKLQQPDYVWDSKGVIPEDAFDEMYKRLKEEGIPTEDKRIPSYVIRFIELYLAQNEKGEQTIIPWEDRLAALYYHYGMDCKNKFISAWFELNLNINNMFTALTARKYDLDIKFYIVGENEVAESLRTSHARDFGLTVLVDYWVEISRIAEETDLYLREKKIDQFKWLWLEENSFFKTFEIDSVFAYLARLEMLERWVILDKAAGEKAFRQLVGSMKKGSDSALDEFKRNNIK